MSDEAKQELNESPTLSEFAKAFAKAQAAMEAAIKDKTNPAFKSKYADFASIVEAVRGPFGANGLSFYQRPVSDLSGVTVVTTILHGSGEFIRGSLRVPVGANTAPAFGTAITYAKRYGLAALAGISTDEDTDVATSGDHPPGDVRADLRARKDASARTVKEAPRPAPSEPQAPTSGKFTRIVDVKPGETETDAIARSMRAKKLGARILKATTLEGLKAWSKRITGKDSSADWTTDDLDHLEAAAPEMERGLTSAHP